jgi:hypothetical protein
MTLTHQIRAIVLDMDGTLYVAAGMIPVMVPDLLAPTEDIAAARVRGKQVGRQLSHMPKSDRLAPKVMAFVAKGHSYRLTGCQVGLSKNTVANIVKRCRISSAHTGASVR